MFEHHFGLRENPFAAGHHAKFVFPSPEHQEAIAHLRYGIENREPFVLITGEVGTGKTTALFDALGEWQSRVEVALITNSALSQNELLEEIALRFGVPISGPASKPQILSHLERVLAGVYARGDRAILLLDEAQNLERDLLEEIRLLSNLERDGTKLLQVFLVGQPELESKLAKAELRQLRQRITVHYRLQPLNAEDTERYIHHRIMVAGGLAGSIFPSKACREVFRLTHGIPREINSVSSQALLNAFVDDARAVAPAHVTSAAAELEFKSVLDRAEAELREAQALDVERLKPKRHELESARPAETAPAARGSAEPAREDIDIKMIEAWMAELSRSKQGSAPAAPLPTSASATARAAARPAQSRPAEPPAAAAAPPARASEAPAGRPLSERLAEAEMLAREEDRVRNAAVHDAPVPAEPPTPKRDLAGEQRAALPPRLRAKLDEELDEELEDFLPRSRGRGLLITALVGVALAITAIMLVRFGIIPGLPFMPGATAHAPASAPAAPTTAAPKLVDSLAAQARLDSVAKTSGATLPHDAGTGTVGPAAASGVSPKPAEGAGAVPRNAAPPARGPVSNVPESSKPAGTAGAGATASAVTTEKPAADKPAAAKSGSTFGIAVATYLNPDRAETEKAKLAASTGMSVSVLEASEGGTSVYHLVLGGFDTRTSAEDAASDLIRRGLVEEARIVPGPKLAKR